MMIRKNKSACFNNIQQEKQVTTRFSNKFANPNDSMRTPSKRGNTRSLQRTRSTQVIDSDTKRKEIHLYFQGSEPNIELRDEKQTFLPWSDAMVRFKKMQHVRINRARLLDWFVDICYNFNQSWQTLWTAIGILDKIIIEKGKIEPNNIHLYGATSLFMASKYIENFKIRISLNDFIHNICYNKYTKKDFLKCEEDIFHWICILRNDLSFHFPTIQDRAFECFPDAIEEGIKLIMIETFYCIQDPCMIFDEEMRDITEKELVSCVRESLMELQRFAKCQDVQMFFFEEYGCNNIRKFGLKLRI